MNPVRRIVQLLAICCVCGVVPPTNEAKEPAVNEDTGVRMEITKLDVNDSTLALSYNIRNATDHEAWVCSKISSIPFEVFLTPDKRTLLIRKRLDVPSSTIWHGPPAPATYVRLLSGDSLADSLQIAMPVSPTFFYATPDTAEVTQTLRRLTLEIGYYDHDLPALIRSIFDVIRRSGLTQQDIPPNLLDTYFRGFRVGGALAGFDSRFSADPYSQGYVRIPYSYQALTGEKILRVEVNGISIPYKGYSEKGKPTR